MSPVAIAIAIFLFVGAAETLHAFRIYRGRWLVFPALRQSGLRRATIGVAFIAAARAIALALLGWGVCTLLQLPPTLTAAEDVRLTDDPAKRRLVVMLDVSPSMGIRDVDGGRLTRGQRATSLLEDLVSRVDLTQARGSMFAFHSDVRPVLLDTVDPNLIRHAVSGLPLWTAFDPGKTDLGRALTSTFARATGWPERSATLVVVTDGDSVASTAIPSAPRAFERIILVGVGDTEVGSLIDGHRSRQDVLALQRIAHRLDASLINGNLVGLPDDLVRGVSGRVETNTVEFDASLRNVALAACAAAAIVLLVLPLVQAGLMKVLSSNLTDGRRRSPRGAKDDTRARMRSPHVDRRADCVAL